MNLKVDIHAPELIEAINKLIEAVGNSNNEINASKDDKKQELVTESKKVEITLEEVRAVLAEKSQADKQKEVKALIVKFGANKLTDIDPVCYEELLKEAEAL